MTATTTTNLRQYINNPRITDYSFSLVSQIQKTTSPPSDCVALYTYLLGMCRGTTALYPQSNWQPHRLMVMSALAVSLQDLTRANECEALAVAWIPLSDCRCCPVRSQDYHYRDSCQYVVYGYWALVQTFQILQGVTNKKYRPLFDNYLRWIKYIQDGKTKTHYEFVNSQVPADVQKAMYNKPFDVAYHTQTFLPVYNRLFL